MGAIDIDHNCMNSLDWIFWMANQSETINQYNILNIYDMNVTPLSTMLFFNF